MKICFVSLIQGSPWGGVKSSGPARPGSRSSADHRVALVIYRWPEIHPTIRDLQERGARLLWMDRAAYWLRNRLPLGRLKLAFERFVYPWGLVASWNPDLVCVNQGSTFSQFVCRPLVRFLTEVPCHMT